MIRSWDDKKARRLFDKGSVDGFPGLPVSTALKRLSALDAAVAIEDLLALESLGIVEDPTRGKGYWSMAVEGTWRIRFRFRRGNVFEVDLAGGEEE